MDTEMIAVRDESREWALDWLTALLPVWLISLFYYRFNALAMEVIAVGGCLAAQMVCACFQRIELKSPGFVQSAVMGLLASFCLPAEAPWWLAALVGGFAGFALAIGEYIKKRVPQLVTRWCFHPVVWGYVIIRSVWSRSFSGYSLPVQWQGIDAFSSATPSAVFSGSIPVYNLWQLFFGIRAGALGEICSAAILLTAIYLLLRRRSRLIAPAFMLATVCFLSWLIWGKPLYGILAGSILPGALLLSDRTYTPASVGTQIVFGTVVGGLAVLIRGSGIMAEGTAYAILAGEVLCFFLPKITAFVHVKILVLRKNGRKCIFACLAYVKRVAKKLYGKTVKRKNNS